MTNFDFGRSYFIKLLYLISHKFFAHHLVCMNYKNMPILRIYDQAYSFVHMTTAFIENCIVSTSNECHHYHC